MQKYLKNNKGFTLVEVIVVAVIVLILAAVAIPLYNGYINDARMSVMNNVAGSIATAAGSARQSNSVAWGVTAASRASAAATSEVALNVTYNGIGGTVTNTIMIPAGVGYSVSTGGTGSGTITVSHNRTTATVSMRF